MSLLQSAVFGSAVGGNKRNYLTSYQQVFSMPKTIKPTVRAKEPIVCKRTVVWLARYWPVGVEKSNQFRIFRMRFHRSLVFYAD